MPRVSVIIPTYNRARTLRRAVESVLSQELEDLEVIVVDDCSTDGTESVVRSFEDPRVQYIAHETNRGGSAARNTGIDAAEGEYVAFLDDDDQYRTEKLRRQVECLDDRSDEWVAVYCNYSVVRSGDSPIDSLPSFLIEWWPGVDSKPRPEGGRELIPRVLAKRFPLGGASTLMLKRETAEQLDGFDSEFPRHQDVEFLIRLLKTGKIAYVDEKLVTKHDTGRPSTNDVEKTKKIFFSRFSSEIAAAERNGYDITGIQRFDLARLYFINGQFLHGAKQLRGAKIELPELLRTVALGSHKKLTARISGTQS